MIKHLRTFGAATAALAVSAVLLAPAFAQQNQGLAGAPGYSQEQQYRGGDNDRYRDNDRAEDYVWGDRNNRGDGWNGRNAPDKNRTLARCSRAANEEAWRNNYYSAQDDGPPSRLVQTRRGWEVHQRMRLHRLEGYSYVDTICELGRSNDVRVSFRWR